MQQQQTRRPQRFFPDREMFCVHVVRYAFVRAKPQKPLLFRSLAHMPELIRSFWFSSLFRPFAENVSLWGFRSHLVLGRARADAAGCGQNILQTPSYSLRNRTPLELKFARCKEIAGDPWTNVSVSVNNSSLLFLIHPVRCAVGEISANHRRESHHLPCDVASRRGINRKSA